MDALAPDTARVLRRAYPRVLARTLALTRDLDAAEHAVQDAVERALVNWPLQGRPEQPEAWLLTVARSRHLDRVRQEQRRERRDDVLESLAQAETWSWQAYAPAATAAGWRDDLLHLLVTCCDPVLSVAGRTALTLATVVGLSTSEIARAFLVKRRTMEQRLTRARRRLRERSDEYEVPDATVIDARLGSVLAVIHLVHNQGYWSSGDQPPIRQQLCDLAFGLSRSLTAMRPDEPEVLGLFALLTLHQARLPGRLDANGRPRPLAKQDRSLWSQADIAEGRALVRHAFARGRPGPFQIEAAIAAVHCAAPSADDTDWAEIAALYEALEALRPSPVVRVNRAFAVGRAEGPEAALALIDELDAGDGSDAVDRYHYKALVRGVLLGELGRFDEAVVELEHAAERARNASERARIERRLDELRSRQG